MCAQVYVQTKADDAYCFQKQGRFLHVQCLMMDVLEIPAIEYMSVCVCVCLCVSVCVCVLQSKVRSPVSGSPDGARTPLPPPLLPHRPPNPNSLVHQPRISLCVCVCVCV